MWSYLKGKRRLALDNIYSYYVLWLETNRQNIKLLTVNIVLWVFVILFLSFLYILYSKILTEERYKLDPEFELS